MGEMQKPGRVRKDRDILIGPRNLPMENVIGFRERRRYSRTS